MEKQFPPYIADRDSILEALQSYLDDLAEVYPEKDKLIADIIVPDDQAYVKALHFNQTACATIRLQSEPHPETIYEINVPYPCQGVFVIRSGSNESAEQDRASLQIWSPALKPIPGLQIISAKSTDIDLEECTESEALSEEQGEVQKEDTGRLSFATRISYCCGFYLRKYFPEESKKKKTSRKTEKEKESEKKDRVSLVSRKAVLRDLSLLSERLSPAFEELRGFFETPANIVINKEKNEKLSAILDKANASLAKVLKASDLIDKHDIQQQRVFTYSAFLVENLAQLIAKAYANDLKGGFSSEMELIESTIWNRFRPRERRKWLSEFRFQNAVDVISKLTAFERYDNIFKNLQHLISKHRQIHPSYKGFVCPVETPESAKVGLSLHLVADVNTTIEGRLVKSDDTETLGHAASILPFYQHNDGARSMMGAKNFVQAMPVKDASPCLIATGNESRIRQAVQKLEQTKLITGLSEGFYDPGKDLLVAYMPWYGWNYEDAIVANSMLSESFSVMKSKRYSEFIPSGYEPANLDSEGNPKVESSKNKKSLGNGGNDAVIVFKHAFKKPLYISLDIPFYERESLSEISFATPPSSLVGGLLVWTVTRKHRLDPGDKLMGRHGNKGVVSFLLEPDDLPRLPEDPRLGDFSGRPVDLILNPHGVISRMNLGQLIETQMGLFQKLGGLPDMPSDIGRPFKKPDYDAFDGAIRKINADKKDDILDPAGKIYLTLPDGGKTAAPVVVGFQYFLRLAHIPSEKAYTRGFDSRSDPITGQPHRGRAKQGGQRLGEMEMWALSEYRVPNILLDCLTDRNNDDNNLPNIEDDESQTFQAIKAHLFGLGIKLHRDELKGYHLDWVTDDDVLSLGEEIVSCESSRDGIEATFHCPMEKCKYSLPERMIATGYFQRSELFQLTARDVLRHNGLTPCMSTSSPKQAKHGVTSTMKVDFIDDENRTVRCSFTIERTTKRGVNVSFEINEEEFNAYKQHQSHKPFTIQTLLEMPIACPDHKREHLTYSDYELTRLEQCRRSLIDESRFGKDKWGYVRLPFPIQYSFKKTGKLTKPAPELNYLPVIPLRYRPPSPPELNGYNKKSLASHYELLLKNVWQSTINSDKANAKLKKAIVDLKSVLQKATFDKDKGLIRQWAIGRQIDSSGRYVIVPNPELGWDECTLPPPAFIKLYRSPLIQFAQTHKNKRNILQFIEDNKRVAPRHLPSILKFLDDYIKHANPIVLVCRQPTLHRYNIKALHIKVQHPIVSKDKNNKDLDDMNTDRWKRFGEERKKSLATIFNEAFGHYGSDEEAEDGDDEETIDSVLRISPLICSSMGADYDGDIVSVFRVAANEYVSNEIAKRELNNTESRRLCVKFREELNQLIPTMPNNLLSVANNEPVASYSQDMVLGTYLISRIESARESFIKDICFKNCAECKILLKEESWTEDVGLAFMKHLCLEHKTYAFNRIEKWSRMAFEFVSRSGISFGIMDCLKCKYNVSEVIDANKASPDDLNRILNGKVIEKLEPILDKPKEPGFGIAAMTISGARGEKQVRQILGARGYLPPNEVGDDIQSKSQWIFDVSLIDGMDSNTAFKAAMNARSSMTDKKLMTGRAGKILREMVWAGWNWTVESGDCGVDSDHRGPDVCLFGKRQRICSACYGRLPDSSEPYDNYPAGLVAAHSIGERCSQLAMQSFHTGSMAIDLNSVNSMLNPSNKNIGTFKDFISEKKKFPDFEKLDPRHFAVLWRIISESPSKTKTLMTAVKNNQKKFVLLGSARTSYPWVIIDKAIENHIFTDGKEDWDRIIIGYRSRPIAEKEFDVGDDNETQRLRLEDQSSRE